MFEASTGVPAANASVRTMPKLSPASEGAQSRSALVQAAPELVGADPAERLDPVERAGVGDVAGDVGAVGRRPR